MAKPKGFFNLPDTLSTVLYNAKQEEFNKSKTVKKLKRPKFVPCQECELYSPKEDGSFGCKRNGKCIYI